MKKNKKYVLQRVAKYTGTILLTSLLLIQPNASTLATTDYNEDLITKVEYETTLSEIKDETPLFKNRDFYNELLNQGITLTKSNISNIPSLLSFENIESGILNCADDHL